MTRPWRVWTVAGALALAVAGSAAALPAEIPAESVRVARVAAGTEGAGPTPVVLRFTARSLPTGPPVLASARVDLLDGRGRRVHSSVRRVPIDARRPSAPVTFLLAPGAAGHLASGRAQAVRITLRGPRRTLLARVRVPQRPPGAVVDDICATCAGAVYSDGTVWTTVADSSDFAGFLIYAPGGTPTHWFDVYDDGSPGQIPVGGPQAYAHGNWLQYQTEAPEYPLASCVAPVAGGGTGEMMETFGSLSDAAVPFNLFDCGALNSILRFSYP